MKNRLTAFRVSSVRDFGLGDPGDLSHPVSPCAVVDGNAAFDKGPVFLVYGAPLELLCDAPRCAHMASKQHDAGDGAIESVWNPQINSPRGVIAFFEEPLDTLFQTVEL